jgi:type III restriction enzyme
LKTVSLGDSLEILDRICEILPPKQDSDRDAAWVTIQNEFPTVTDFEREFPSLCFSLATGVGKTRLMGAFISYLHLAHGIKNFFLLAPNLTIYNKLIADFTPNTPSMFSAANEPPRDYRHAPTYKSNMARYICGGAVVPTDIGLYAAAWRKTLVLCANSPRCGSLTT